MTIYGPALAGMALADSPFAYLPYIAAAPVKATSSGRAVDANVRYHRTTDEGV
jgi:hypothetical protein